MKRLLLIGIGAGDPGHLTLQAVKAIAAADVFFVVDKGEEKRDLTDLRHQFIKDHGRQPYRIVTAPDPERDRLTPAYAEAVEDWRERRATLYHEMIDEALGEGQTGAFLIWGDPGVYDSTLASLEMLPRTGFEIEVIPGISAMSALTARHRISLTRVARPVHLSTGRRLAEQGPTADDMVIMLDARHAFDGLDDFDIYWGAYLGTPDEILIAGPVAEAGPRIREARARARESKGWIMDTYLLRRR
ncbi:precorrin-6A synthase (deacetylating) [Acrocarpospora phusangensis]|uniref:Precorrin-6A synthase (Deacetylating) n=1 Tax=Acrocarpospora phusangensis TaxID=1070424 RepID=A0A919Q7G3_9ACTN|nr:precorrin-6A synthase (deacetylating) [Acrocarpospora phusangensis]GIH23591.1 precorrin-6A synthase (deacetylating) [Acrocarpospora phusangensis]